MAKFTYRLQLDKVELEDLSASVTEPSAPDSPGGEEPVVKDFPALSPLFSFERRALPGYGTALPASDVEFAFPATDQERVQAWFTGDYSHVSNPESSTLKKNMTAAVIGALDRYNETAASRDLLTAPCRVGWRYRLFDGSAVYPCAPLTLIPDWAPPELVITGYNLYEKLLHTDITFSVSPSALLFAIPAPQGGEDFRDIITSVEFFLSRPQPYFPESASVSGIRSVTVNGKRERVWKYESLAAESVEGAATSDRDLRVVAAIPFADILDGGFSVATDFPIDSGALGRFPSLQKVTLPSSFGGSWSGGTGATGTTSGSSGTSGIGWRPYLHVITPALDLGRPEVAKAVTEVFLRGIFQRHILRVTLYGSHHRENWRLIARARGPYIRGIRRAPYRWLKVEIELPMRKGDFIDAITFRYL